MNPQNFIVTPDIYASKEKRFVNMIIDVIAYYVLSFIVGILFGILELIGITGILDYIATMGPLGNLIFGIIIVGSYFTVFEVLTQKTLGKLISKTMVVLEDGSKPTTKDVLIRTFSRFIPFEAFSFLGSEGRGWHDSISDTYVVDTAKFKAKVKAENELDLIGVSQED
ncbi:RDD family protein [Seonamhaeicola sp.]|uniref:RDD family protein n=1 Tax=Seonamhaeicola sp. TaxID=1912245 RepID=UPI00262963FB|nr:RDD family protein [Seonamhaeicola sp.]